MNKIFVGLLFIALLAGLFVWWHLRAQNSSSEFNVEGAQVTRKTSSVFKEAAA